MLRAGASMSMLAGEQFPTFRGPSEFDKGMNRMHVGAIELEPWTMLGHLVSCNRFGRLRFGVGVTDASRRHPAVTAQAAATLHLITRGRTILGIGVGDPECNEPYGVDWTKPVARFEE